MALKGTFYQGEPRYMRLRGTPLVIRIHKFKMDTETHDFCLSELELFYIFEDQKERMKCEEDIEFCYNTYMANQKDIMYVKKKAMPFMTNVEEAMETAQEIMHNDIGDVLDPEHEQDQDDLDLEGVEETDNFIAFDYDKEPNENDSLPAEKMFKRVEVNQIEILSKLTRDLDNDQMYVVQSLINYAKSYQ